MDLTMVYTKNPDFVQRDVAGECILVPMRRSPTVANNIYVLNETGAVLWHNLDGKQTLSDIVTAFCDEYDVSSDQLQRDFETLLEDLLSIQAIRKVPTADGRAG